MLGCTPAGRYTEQHDIFFSIGDALSDIKEEMVAFWPEAKGKIHVDAWREVTAVDGYKITVVEKSEVSSTDHLFFMNLGGYKEGVFDEPHYKMLIVAPDKGEAIKKAKASAFYKHTGFVGATSHIDDKYGVDVDDAFEIIDVLSGDLKERFSLKIDFVGELPNDEIHLGYLMMSKI